MQSFDESKNQKKLRFQGFHVEKQKMNGQSRLTGIWAFAGHLPHTHTSEIL
jgi:hypothetical protein